MKTVVRYSSLFLFLQFMLPFLLNAQMRTQDLTKKISLEGSSAYEVTSAVSKKGIMILGWMEAGHDQSTLHDKPMGIPQGSQCSFSTSSDNGKTWKTKISRRHSDHDSGSNPAVAADDLGNLYAVCMSVEGYYSSGILEISSSHDNGATWSEWKTVFKTESGIPDKPWLIAVGDSLWLGFSNILKQGLGGVLGDEKWRSQGTLLYSQDHGLTWSKQVFLKKIPQIQNPQAPNSQAPTQISQFPIQNLRSQARNDDASFLSGEQGLSFAKTYKNQLLVSWGMYHGDIWFSANKAGTERFCSPELVSHSDVQVSITHLISDEKGKKLAIVWYEAHSMGKVYLVTSENKGVNWSPRITLTEKGNLASGQIDSKGKLHLIWTQKTTDHVEVKYANLAIMGNALDAVKTVTSEEYRSKPITYLGAYQNLSLTSDGKLHAFWLNWENDFSSIFHTTWHTTWHTN